MKKLIIIILTLSALSAMARVKNFHQPKGACLKGDWCSGGGNAVVCFDNQTSVDQTKSNAGIIPDNVLSDIKSIEMYDLYEAKMGRGLSRQTPEIIEAQDNEDEYQYISAMANRYKGRVNYLYRLVKNAQEILPADNIRYANHGIDQQHDIANVVLPTGKCLITTMARQVNIGEHFKLIVDRRLYEHKVHSRQSQAVLKLHEVVYAFLRKYFNHSNSATTRELVSLLITHHESIHESSVAKTINDLNIVVNDWEILGVLSPNTFFDFNEVKDVLKPYVLSTNFMLMYELLQDMIHGPGGDIEQELLQSVEFKSFYFETLEMARRESINVDDIYSNRLDHLGQIFREAYKVSDNKQFWMKRVQQFEEITKEVNDKIVSFIEVFPAQARRTAENPYGGWLTVEWDKYPELFEEAFKYASSNYSSLGMMRRLSLKADSEYSNRVMETLFRGVYYSHTDMVVYEKVVFNKPIPKRVE